MLDTIAHGFSLQHLRSVDLLFKGGRQLVRLLHVAHDDTVGIVVALVLLHDVGEQVAVLRQSESFDGLHGREGLESELGQITEAEFTILCKGFATVPDVPVMDVAAVFIVRVVKTAAGGRTGRNVRSLRIVFHHHAWNDVLVHGEIIRHLRSFADVPAGILMIRVVTHGHGEELLHLIVAGPKP